ncbi:hypothetical protein D1B31_17835 [Neobacillus notoginsengisoli]|uniref:Uncharacterized protein n=1 Tax=Neobacillus notoginsengisoli TaxID=1578198 RepID=A0A417YQ90_9BACI|nr:hypothetical protein [Neobacillus notoginsengisoli]RHW35953.1 hypothetical protein D1B31_17835 [Neobacillus notoginsengisoli]
MIIEFYIGSDQFVVSGEKIFKNGEVIAEGVVNVQHLMMNEPAWFIVDQGEEIPVLCIKTKPITAVLPHNQFANGQRLQPNKSQSNVNEIAL